MTTNDITSADLPGLRSTLVERLCDFRRKVRARLVSGGAARVLIEAVALALLSLILDRWLRLGLAARLVYLFAAVVVLIFETRRWILLPLKLDLSDAALVAMLDARRSTNGNGSRDLSQRVASVLELPGLLDRGRIPSAAMVERAVVRSYQSLRDIEFDQALDDRRHHRVLAAIALGLLVPIGLTLAAPRTARLWFARYFMGSSEPWPQRTYLQMPELFGGRIIVPRGEPYVLRVAAREGSQPPDDISLRFRPVSDRGSGGAASFTRFGPNDFRYEFPWVNEELAIEVRGGDDIAEPFFLHPVDRPKIVHLELASQHPTQLHPESHSFSGQNSGDVSFLPKTEMRLALSANVPIAEVKPEYATPRPGQPAFHRVDDRTFELKWTHETPVQLRIALVGAESGLVSLPMPVAIGLKKDQPPRVTLRHSGVRQRVTPQAKIPLIVTARDDYGVAEMALAVKTERSDPNDPTKMSTDETTSPLASATQPSASPEMVQTYTFDVTARKLPPGAVLSLIGLATDACYTGRQTAHSRTDTFRVVAPEELFKEILLRQQAERAKFRKAIEEVEKVREALVILASQEMAGQLLQRHRTVQREVARIANSLAESVTEMKLNALGSPEAYDLMDRNILDSLKHLQSDLMNPQRAALEALGKSHDAPRLSDVTARQEEILAKMRAILKQMAQWDSFVDVLNQLSEIIRLEEQVKQGTDELRKKQTDAVFEK